MATVLPGDRWKKVEQLFEQAADLPSEAREQFLACRCIGDPQLLAEVLSLLHCDSAEERPLLDALQFAAASLVDDDAAPGRRVGPYRIEHEIGRGGMSVVYLAVRDDGEFRKRVAIKLIKRGMDTEAVVERLRQERAILAALEHPSIARLLDGGTTGSGRPWLAMEYVEGLPIHRFCEERKLSREERCRLIVRVCDAAAYAHRNLVVHRDLKPANILVTPEGNPKLLDFGIAKVLSVGDEQDPEMRGIRPLTPGYASPEQRRGGRVGITTDVYSIGVVLFELLAGRRPDASAGETAPGAGADLDAIVAKALAPEPEHRYPSADQLAEDLRRYLAGLPVSARPATLRYRAMKFVGRNRLGVAAAAVVVVALAGGIAAIAWEAHTARREAATAQAVTDFLRNDLLGQASPNAQAGPDLKVRTALDRAAGRMDGKFAGKPLVEADIRNTIAESYAALGLYPEAQRQYERVWALRGGALGEKHRDSLDALTSIAVLYRLQGKLPEAERLYNKVLDVERIELGERDPSTLLTMSNLAVVYSHQQKYAQAEELNLKVLAIQKSVLGVEHLDTLRTMNNLGVDYTKEGKFAEAERLYRQILEVRRRVQGPGHPNTIFTLNNLAVVYARPGGNYQAAEQIYKEALDWQQRNLGPDHPDTLLTMSNLGLLWCWHPEKYAEAEQMLKEAAEGRRRALGAAHRDTLASWVDLGRAQMLQGKFVQAESTLRPTCAAYAEARLDVWERYDCQTLLGESLVGQKRYSEAEPLLLAGYRELQLREASIPAMSKGTTVRAAGWLARLYAEQGKKERAEEWKQRASTAQR